MKRIKKVLSLIMLLNIFLIGCKETIDYTKLIKEAISTINIESVVEDDLVFLNEIEYKDVTYLCSWETNNKAISNTGVVTRGNEDVEVVITLTCSYGEVTCNKDFMVIVKKLDVNYEEIINKGINSLVIPSETSVNIELKNSIEVDGFKVLLNWSSSDSVLSNEGVVNSNDIDTEVVLSLQASLNEVIVNKDYNIVVLGENVLEKAFSELILVSETSSNIDFNFIINIGEKEVIVVYTTNNVALSSKGEITPTEEEDILVNVIVALSCGNNSLTKSLGDVVVLSYKSQIEKELKTINIPNQTNEDINLPTIVNNVNIQWISSNTSVLTKTGICKYVSQDTTVTLTADCYIEYGASDTYFYAKEYSLIVKPYDVEKRYDLIIANISIPATIQANITLKTNFEYDVTGLWNSSNEDVINSQGIINYPLYDTKVVLTLTLSCSGDYGKDYTFDVVISGTSVSDTESNFYSHNLVDRVANYVSDNMINLEYSNNKVILSSTSLTGTYESRIFNTLNFESMVGCWSCVTSKTATCEVEFSVRVDGVWSQYFTYGEWGLGKGNYYYNASDNIAKINVDEIVVLNNKKANGIKYRVTLKRDSLATESPILSLVSCALDIPNYESVVDTSALPNSFDIDVPRLYQHDVPTIGGSICSATTTTMLLKYKGFSFTDKGYAYEHQYMAYMVADPGHNSPTYGNWSYNMATAGAFGVDAYVGRMYSWDELKYHLVNVGPVGASIKGTFGSYTTNGHLIVVRGYRVTNGSTTVICNDPNIKGVYYEVTLQTFMNCWRNVVYIVE